MKKTFALLFLSLVFTTSIHSQNKFSVGYSGGIVSPSPFIFVNGYGKHGVRYNLILNYKIRNKINVYISGGEIIYGQSNNFLNNVALVPLNLGLNYFAFGSKTILPFFTLEISKIFGRIIKWRNEKMNGRFTDVRIFKEEYEKKMFGFGISAGLGIRNKINEQLSIDVTFMQVLYSEDTNAFYSRLFLGFNYGF